MTELRAGLRLGVGVSGGADSVALLQTLAERAGELGLVLTALHLHHGLRGAEADGDLEFVRSLAGELGLPFVSARMDVGAEAARTGETIEEAARRVRYGWFRELMVGAGAKAPTLFEGHDVRTEVRTLRDGAEVRTLRDGTSLKLDAVATAHTLDDQAETVLAKVLRGAWLEGMSGIHPVVTFAEGRVVRPLLGVRRAEVEAYLKELGQAWREDSSNRHLTFTRNRIRHELVPVLEGWNPKLKEHLGQMAELARDEESWWEAEVARVAPEVILEGRPVRGGGRAAAEGIALDVGKLAGLEVALQRRVVRFAVERLGLGVDFAGTEALRELALGGRAGQKCELAGGLRAERTHRELRISIQAGVVEAGPVQVEVPVPGAGEGFGWRVRIEVVSAGAKAQTPNHSEDVRTEVRTLRAGAEALSSGATAVLRTWKAGDRVHLRHSSGPRKVKEVLERMKVNGAERARWPVLELGGRIVWMQGVAVELEAGIAVTVTPLETGSAEARK